MNEDLVIVASGDRALIAVAKSQLDGAGIEYVVQNEYLDGSIDILARESDASAAIALLTDLNRSYYPTKSFRRLPRAQKIMWLALVLSIPGVGIAIAVLDYLR